MHFIISIALTFCTLFVTGCQTAYRNSEPIASSHERLAIQSAIAAERDEIFSLLAYAVVVKDWQRSGVQQRGHNIGAVLVDEAGKPVFWARNCNHITQNGTQHAEVRVMLGYLSQVRTYSLKEHTVYTTLEPCAQCAGMMILQNVPRTVYGQTDPGFGKAVERLRLDSSNLRNGYKPYPRPVISEKSQSSICSELDGAFAEAGGSITDFLLTPQAKQIFERAREQFLNLKVKHRENQAVYDEALRFYDTNVTDHYNPLDLRL